MTKTGLRVWAVELTEVVKYRISIWLRQRSTLQVIVWSDIHTGISTRQSPAAKTMRIYSSVLESAPRSATESAGIMTKMTYRYMHRSLGPIVWCCIHVLYDTRIIEHSHSPHHLRHFPLPRALGQIGLGQYWCGFFWLLI